MIRPIGRALLWATLGFASFVPQTATHAQETQIADIKASPNRYFNRQLTVRGQATEVVARSEGLSQGTYRLLDDSDPQGILVRTGAELPIPGRIYTVTGTVSQLSSNAAQLGLVEGSRSGERPAWLLAIVILSGLSAVVLAVLLWRTLAANEKKDGTRRQPTPVMTPSPVVPPPPTPVVPPTPLAAAPPQPTLPFTPPRQATMPFDVSGASLCIVEGPESGKEVPIGITEFLIGRPGSRTNHFPVNDPTVSQSHARVRWDKSADRFFLVNESQTNKARLDGSPTEMAELVPGSRIQLGAVTLEFRRNGRNGTA